jgi:hypothetical protein
VIFLKNDTYNKKLIFLKSQIRKKLSAICGSPKWKVFFMKIFLNIVLMSVSCSALAQVIDEPSFFRDVLPKTIENMAEVVSPVAAFTACGVAGFNLIKIHDLSRSLKLIKVTINLLYLNFGTGLVWKAAKAIQELDCKAGRKLTPLAIKLRDFQVRQLEAGIYTTLATAFFLRRAK